MNLSVQHAVVVGGGIGGLSTAAALRRAGVSVTVLEGRRELSAAQAGGGMHLWHNGTRALADLGLGRAVDALVADGARLSTAEFCSSTGALLARWPVHRIEDAVGAPTVGIDRGRLHDLLLHAAAGADIRRGAVCTGFRQDDQRVSARLADGESVTGDVLVGADGLRSVVRRQLLGDRAPRPAGYASWQAIVDFEDDACPVGLFRVLWGPGARFLFYRLSAGTLYWEGQFAAAPGGQDASTGRKVAVLRRFAGYADPVRAILEATPERAITRLDVYDREPVRTWGHGRVTLLGDAAHPMTNAIGQGANQALEDAVVLAAVAREATDWPTALRAYERRRIPRTTSMVRTAHNLQRLNRLDSPAACLVRNQLLRGGLRLGFRKHAKDMALAY